MTDKYEQRLPDCAQYRDEWRDTVLPQTIEPYVVGHPEHTLRYAFITGDIRGAMGRACQVIEYFQEHELELLSPDNLFEEALDIEELDDFLRHRINENAGQELYRLRTQRENWFDDMEMDLLNRTARAYRLLEEHDAIDVTDLRPSITEVIHDTSTVSSPIEFHAGVIDIGDNDCKLASQLRCYTPPQVDSDAPLHEFGIDQQIPLLFAKSPSGSTYPFVPYNGITICTCGDKISCPHKSPLCKHEIAAFLLKSQNKLRSQVDSRLPARALRMVHPSQYSRYSESQQV